MKIQKSIRSFLRGSGFCLQKQYEKNPNERLFLYQVEKWKKSINLHMQRSNHHYKRYFHVLQAVMSNHTHTR